MRQEITAVMDAPLLRVVPPIRGTPGDARLCRTTCPGPARSGEDHGSHAAPIPGAERSTGRHTPGWRTHGFAGSAPDQLLLRRHSGRESKPPDTPPWLIRERR